MPAPSRSAGDGTDLGRTPWTSAAPRRLGATWVALALLAANGFLGCAAHPDARHAGDAAVFEVPAGNVHVSIVWRSRDEAVLQQLAEWIESMPTDDRVRRGTHTLEVAFSAPLAELETRLSTLRPGVEWQLRARERSVGDGETNAGGSGTPSPITARAQGLGLAGGAGVRATDRAPDRSSRSGWTWHASAAAAPGDLPATRRILERLARDVAPFDDFAAAAQETIASGTFLVDRAASLPSELRFVPAAELDPAASPEDRARSLLAAAGFARANPGWTLVPASVDLAGRREPAYLYASADVAGAQARLFSMLEPARADSGAMSPAVAKELLARRTAFAAAQLEDLEFRLRAQHSRALARFEADARALRDLDPERLASVGGPGFLTAGGRLAVVGPAIAWRETLAARGRCVELERAGSSDMDLPEQFHATMLSGSTAADIRVQRMLAALGGRDRWRELDRVHLLGLLVPPDGTHQGVEQWAELSTGRFALAQAVGAEETLIACDAAAAWIHDGRAGVDLSVDQARKFRTRAERTWFAVLARLARPGHGGLTLADAGDRIVLRDDGLEWCWIEPGPDELPRRLGYRVVPGEPESLYEFSDWRLEGPLPYPAVTRQVDRDATFEIRHLEVGGKLDPALWTR